MSWTTSAGFGVDNPSERIVARIEYEKAILSMQPDIPLETLVASENLYYDTMHWDSDMNGTD